MAFRIGEEVWKLLNDSRRNPGPSDLDNITRKSEFTRLQARTCLVDFWRHDPRNPYPRFLSVGAYEGVSRPSGFYGLKLIEENGKRYWKLEFLDEMHIHLEGFTGYTLKPTYGAKDCESLTIRQAIAQLHSHEKKWVREREVETGSSKWEVTEEEVQDIVDSAFDRMREEFLTVPSAPRPRGIYTISRDRGFSYQIDPTPDDMSDSADLFLRSVIAPSVRIPSVRIGTYDRDASVLGTLDEVLNTDTS